MGEKVYTLFRDVKYMKQKSVKYYNVFDKRKAVKIETKEARWHKVQPQKLHDY